MPGTIVSLLLATWLAQALPIPMPGPLPMGRTGHGASGTVSLTLLAGMGRTEIAGEHYALGGGAGYFLAPGISVGFEGQLRAGGGVPAAGLVVGTIQTVPMRLRRTSIYLVGKAGRLLRADAEDFYALGGGIGVVRELADSIGVSLGIDYLRLMPTDRCAELSTRCDLPELLLGLVVWF